MKKIKPKTFTSSGRALKREPTRIFIPYDTFRVFKGLRTLRVLTMEILKELAEKAEIPIIAIIKSSIFQ